MRAIVLSSIVALTAALAYAQAPALFATNVDPATGRAESDRHIRIAPLPATAWAGIAVMGGIVVARAVRRRAR